MNRLLASIVLLAGAAACGNNNSNHGTLVDAPVDHVDAPVSIDAPPNSNLNDVQLYAFGSPSVLAYRDGNGPWQSIAPNETGIYTLEVTDAYVAEMICTGSGGFVDDEEIAATYSGDGEYDGPTAFIECSNGAATSTGGGNAITGTMVQAGTVTLSDSASSATGNWTYSLDVPTGTHDLVATDATDILIRRNVDIEAAATEDAIDLGSGGSPLVDQPITVSGAGSDMLSTSVALYTATNFDYVVIDNNTTATVQLVPAALLVGLGTQTGDQELIAAAATSATTYRYTEVNDPTVTTFPLLDPLSGVAFAPANGSITASWTTLPADPYVIQLELYGVTTESILNVNATAAWLASNTSLGLDTSVTGWQPAFAFWTGEEVSDFFAAAVATVETEYQITGVFDETSPTGGAHHPSRALPSRAMIAQQVRAVQLARHRAAAALRRARARR